MMEETSLVSLLTQRELEVTEFLARGLSDQEIAWRMRISKVTVKNHVAAARGKANAKNRLLLVVRYLRETGI